MAKWDYAAITIALRPDSDGTVNHVAVNLEDVPNGLSQILEHFGAMEWELVSFTPMIIIKEGLDVITSTSVAIFKRPLGEEPEPFEPLDGDTENMLRNFTGT